MGEFLMCPKRTKKRTARRQPDGPKEKVDNYIIAQKHKNSKPRGEIHGSYYASHYSSRN